MKLKGLNQWVKASQKRYKSHLKVISNCFVLLGKNEISKLQLVALAQLFLALIDFVCVFSIGLIGTLSVYGIQSRAPGSRVQWILEVLNLADLNFQTQVAVLGVCVGVILTSKSLLSAWLNRRTLFFLSNRSADLSIRIIEKLTFSNFEQIRKRNRFENIFAVTNGVQSITVGVIGQVVGLASDLVLILIMFLGLFVVDPSIAISTLIFFSSFAFGLYLLVNKKVTKLSLQDLEIQIRNGQLLYELFGSYREIFVGGLREKYVGNIASVRRKGARVVAESRFMSDMSKYVFEVAFVLGAFLFVGVQFLIKDAVGAISSISIFIAATGRIIPAILRVQYSALSFRGSIALASKTLQMIEELKEVEIQLASKKVPSHEQLLNPTIELRNVSFGYLNSSRMTLKNLTLKIDKGEFVAIIGPSGAGKTTLVDNMIGILKPTIGEIYISGLEPEQVTLAWPGAIAYVPQDSFVSEGTVKASVAFGVDETLIDNEHVESCLRAVGLYDEIMKHGEGLNFNVGELGTKLSGGQRQRLGLARALYAKPKILILDEATSALDTFSEQKILECINMMKNKVTIIAIAHRLSTVKNADRLVYLKEGEIQAIGSFTTLKEKIPEFETQIELASVKFE